MVEIICYNVSSKSVANILSQYEGGNSFKVGFILLQLTKSSIFLKDQTFFRTFFNEKYRPFCDIYSSKLLVVVLYAVIFAITQLL